MTDCWPRGQGRVMTAVDVVELYFPQLMIASAQHASWAITHLEIEPDIGPILSYVLMKETSK